jgi:hypothetical protein
MPVAEIAAAVTGIRAALDITKAMVDLRDAEAFRAKSIELQSVVLDAFEKAIEAREAHVMQADRIRSLEAEVADLKAWDAEKGRYQLYSVGRGAVAYSLKPNARGTEAPHWLCPNCFNQNKKSFFQSPGTTVGRDRVYTCSCGTIIATGQGAMSWPD